LAFNIEPEATGRPGYHPATLLKLYAYGYLNQVQSSRRLERECGRNLELIWLMGRLAPDFKTIADFRKDNGPAMGRDDIEAIADKGYHKGEAIVACENVKVLPLQFPNRIPQTQQHVAVSTRTTSSTTRMQTFTSVLLASV